MDIQFLRELLSAVIDEFKAYKKACTTLFVVVMFACLLVAVNWPEKFTTTALIEADRKSVTSGLLKGRVESQEATPVSVAKEVIRSRPILTETARQLGLIDELSPQQEKDEAINRLSASFETDSISKYHNLMRISFNSNDPEFSYEALKTLTDVFIQNASQQQQSESLGAFNFIDAEVQKRKADLEKADQKLSEFKSLNMDGTESEVSTRINTLKTDLEKLNIDIDTTRTKIASIKQKLSDEQVYQKDKVKLAELSEQRSARQNSLDRLSLSYTESHPDIISLRAQIDSLDKEIAKLQTTVPGGYSGDSASEELALFDELRKQQSNAEVELQSMLQRKRSTQALLNSETARADRIARNQATLTELTRDYDKNKQLYNDMLERRANAGLSVSLDREGQGLTYQIREHPVLPLTPSGLQAKHFILIGPILGLLAPLGLLVLYVLLDPRIRTEGRLKMQLPEGIELLGSIPAYSARASGAALARADFALLALGTLALIAYAYTAFAWIRA